MADEWMPTYPWTEAALLLRHCPVVVAKQVVQPTIWKIGRTGPLTWKKSMPISRKPFESFIDTLVDVYAEYTPEMAAKETGGKPANYSGC
ncbi:MAG: hypothetical protein R2788_16340 [Saprospiraceae bacterium]